MQWHITVIQTKDILEKLVFEAWFDLKTFFEIIMIYFKVDASSYKNLSSIFTESGELKLSDIMQTTINELKNEIWI